MNKKLIELELRAEIPINEVKNIKKRLSKIGEVSSITKRLSVMFFGKINKQKTDIRVRVTNGECEVVVKFGSFGSHNRIELCQKIEKNQFFGMVKIFSQFKFDIKVGERETFNYKLKNDIVISLVLAENIAYIEFEKMSFDTDVIENKIRLQKLVNNLNLQILNESEFNILCQKLNELVDWTFHGLDCEYLKLKNIFKKYIKIKKAK